MNKISTIGTSASIYRTSFEQRLHPQAIEPDQEYLLMMRNTGAGGGFDSYLAQATVREVSSLGATAGLLIELSLLGPDGEPAFAIDSAVSPDGIWTPERPPLHLSYRVSEIAIDQGHLLPSDVDPDVDDFLAKRELKVIDPPGVHSHRPIA